MLQIKDQSDMVCISVEKIVGTKYIARKKWAPFFTKDI